MKSSSFSFVPSSVAVVCLISAALSSIAACGSSESGGSAAPSNTMGDFGGSDSGDDSGTGGTTDASCSCGFTYQGQRESLVCGKTVCVVGEKFLCSTSAQAIDEGPCAGAGGASGAAGSLGAAGSENSAGTAGAAGTVGSAGSAGIAGQAGSSSGGALGSDGSADGSTSSMGGSTGTAGTAGAAGTAGTGAGGAVAEMQGMDIIVDGENVHFSNVSASTVNGDVILLATMSSQPDVITLSISFPMLAAGDYTCIDKHASTKAYLQRNDGGSQFTTSNAFDNDVDMACHITLTSVPPTDAFVNGVITDMTLFNDDDLPSSLSGQFTALYTP